MAQFGGSNDLLQQARQAYAAGHPHQSRTLLEQLLTQDPANTDALHLLGILLFGLGEMERAVTLFRQFIHLTPNDSAAHNSLGLALRAAGNLIDSELALRRALSLDPRNAPAFNNLGITLKLLNRFPEAIQSYNEALRLAPTFAEAENSLGNAHFESGDAATAIPHLRRATQLHPQYAEAWSNLALALQQDGQHAEAEHAFREALRLNPANPDFHSNLAKLLELSGHVDEAHAQFSAALNFNPNHLHATLGLAAVELLRAQPARAVAIYRDFLTRHPDNLRIRDALLFALLNHPDATPEEIHLEHTQWAMRIEATPEFTAFTNTPDPDRRLRIAYVSADFRDHVVAKNILPLFEHRNREQFHLTAYSLSAYADAMTNRLRTMTDAWQNLANTSDESAADTIRNDRIDIVIDMSMHTAGNRLGIFARRAAPLQVTFAAYPGTTGLKRIDYRISDALLDPEGDFDRFYSEKSLRLSHSFWCYAAMMHDTPITELPALRNGHITFAGLGNSSKINANVLTLWARVLNAIPNSRLHLLMPEGSARQHALHLMSQHNIEPARLTFLSRVSPAEYMQLYNHTDIALDTLPYNGHTTTLDALSMGVPVITLVGNTVVGRAALSQLTRLNLTDLITTSPDDFIHTAATLVADLPKLTHLRQTLRDRLRNSPLCDAPGWTHEIEQTLRTIWKRWCHQ